MGGGTPYPVKTLPKAADVVWTRFPWDESRNEPGPPHPCLVFHTAVHPKTGIGGVKVAFGTSNIERGERGRNFIISNVVGLNTAGLRRETLFDLGRWRWLLWTDRWFFSPDPKRWSTPVIGCLDGERLQRLRTIVSIRQQWGLDCP